MAQSPSTNIYEILRSLGIVKHKKRQEFICDIVEGLIESRSVHFSQIAAKIKGKAKVASIERRIQDFFQKVSFDYLQLGVFFMGFVPHQRVVVSIDRTEWDFGGTQINILCAVVSIGKMAIPIYFEMLDNNSGNSHTNDRIALLKSIIAIIGTDRIALLVMDREFVGNKWWAWLQKQGINFCVRVPASHKITLIDGSTATAEELLQDKKSYYAENVVVDNVRVNLSLSYGKDQKLLFLVGTLPYRQLQESYQRRWAVETFFQALKDRGFHIESSCLQSIEKYRKLFAIVAIAYTLCWATGIEDGKCNPVKRKKHGYPQYSVFRRGLNLIREFYKQKMIEPFTKAIQLAIQRILINLKTIG